MRTSSCQCAGKKTREVETGFRDTALMCGPAHVGGPVVAPGQLPPFGQPTDDGDRNQQRQQAVTDMKY